MKCWNATVTARPGSGCPYGHQIRQRMEINFLFIITRFGPATRDFAWAGQQVVGDRAKPGHDGEEKAASGESLPTAQYQWPSSPNLAPHPPGPASPGHDEIKI